MDAHVPQCTSVVRLSPKLWFDRWPAWLPAMLWMLLLACLPWWAGLPLLLALAAIQLAQLPRLQHYGRALRYALRWGLVGVLAASYLAFDHRALGLTFTMLAALAGFSLLMLLESWQRRTPQRHAAAAAAVPEWRELALAPIGPADTLIELEPPHWLLLDSTPGELPAEVVWPGTNSCQVGQGPRIESIEPQVCVAPGQRWFAWPMTTWRGVVLYDRACSKVYKLRGWHFYGWHGSEAWLTRGDDQAPMALSHVLGQDRYEP